MSSVRLLHLGLPDFRAVFLAPVGFLWTGNVLAAKITYDNRDVCRCMAVPRVEDIAAEIRKARYWRPVCC